MIELLSTETKPVYIGYNKLAADGGHRQRTRRQAGQATQRNTAWL